MWFISVRFVLSSMRKSHIPVSLLQTNQETKAAYVILQACEV